MKKILVTGSSGYIGKSFIKKYQDKYEFFTFSFQNDLLKNISLFNIDTILHCAALVHQNKEYSYEQYYKINVEYSVALAKKAKKEGVRHFIYLSSVSIYGDSFSKVDLSTETNASTFYGKSKLEAEKALLSLKSEVFFITIIRPSLVYGNGAPGNMQKLVFLVKQMNILPFGGIVNRRSILYIDNLSYIISYIITKRLKGIFLVADTNALSTTTLVELIAHALNKKIFNFKSNFFATLLKYFKPSIYKKLFQSFEVKSNFNEPLPYTTKDGIELMIRGEDK